MQISTIVEHGFLYHNNVEFVYEEKKQTQFSSQTVTFTSLFVGNNIVTLLLANILLMILFVHGSQKSNTLSSNISTQHVEKPVDLFAPATIEDLQSNEAEEIFQHNNSLSNQHASNTPYYNTSVQ